MNVAHSSPASAIPDIVRHRAERNPNHIALSAPRRKPLTYLQLFEQLRYVIASLNRSGLGRKDRVGIVLSRGPEMGACILGVAAGAGAVPFNPDLRLNDLKQALEVVRVQALIIESGIESPIWELASSQAIPILELIPSADCCAGLFRLEPKFSASASPAHSGFSCSEDVALILTTSGTTSQPKVVPLTQANITLSAQNIATSLALSSTDCCLDLMPLFHGHGLIGGLLASFAAGGSAFIPPGPHAPQFFDWLGESSATWYTAVPTMHQAIVERAQQGGGALRHSLRFVRSCSAALPPSVAEKLEEIFHVPVIEAYGMTETSHQIASNPLPPKTRKPLSVGLPTGVEISIFDASGQALPNGSKGEVVIRGETVVPGYENNPDANRKSFVQGWLRTGDEGYLDSDGYLYLTGRLKELINRGAEKISPREIDDVLLEHPAVAQAVAFAVPHLRLGEDVAAAVVLRSRAHATEQDLRKFASEKLANFKVPRRILILDEIPKGPTGKIQRVGLAARLGLVREEGNTSAPKAEFVAPRNAAERTIAGIWAELLAVPSVGVEDDFFDLGGDSIMAAELFQRIAQATGVLLSLVRFPEATTVSRQALMVEQGESSAPPSVLVPLQSSGMQEPLFCVPPAADVSGFRELARALGHEHPFYALQPFRLADRYAVEYAAQCYLAEIESVQTQGRYFLVGHCAGAFAALHLARCLRSRGRSVALFVIHPLAEGLFSRPLSTHWRRFKSLKFPEKISYATNKASLLKSTVAKQWKQKMTGSAGGPLLQGAEQNVNEQIHRINRSDWKRHFRESYSGAVDLFVTERSLQEIRPSLDPRSIWGKIANEGLNVHLIPGDHVTVLRHPHVQILARQLREAINRVGQNSKPPIAVVS